MTYARIRDRVIVDIIILDDVSLIPIFSEGFDFFIAVVVEPGGPQMGWSFDQPSGTFAPPIESV